MSKSAAEAVYPHLAKPEVERRQAVRDQSAKPEWGKSDGPLWGEPPPIVKDYSKVPGLVKLSNRRVKW